MPKSGLLDEKGKRPKYQNRRALVLRAQKYVRQYKRNRKKTLLYQNQLLSNHGPECMFLFTWEGLERAVDQFNEMYGDGMHVKHGIVLLMIKHVTGVMRRPDFLTRELMEFFPNMKTLLGKHGANKVMLSSLVSELYKLHFLNASRGDRYQTTTRLRIFIAAVQKHADELYKGTIENE